ncbi:MAG TPA: hypothetical protein VMV95_00190 [Bacillota bacterium]|nr:hypothetical protein [Bacillota bacterium]
MTNSDFSPQSIWNFDDAAMQTLSYYVSLCLDAFLRWDLNSINIYLRTIRRIASWGIKDKDWNTMEKKFEELEKLKREIEKPKQENNKNKIEFYNKADEIFVEIGRCMQKEGWVFRKGNDPRFAALRR